jgi:hypothetical protein
MDLVGTESLGGLLGDEAKSRSLSQENPLTGKPDALCGVKSYVAQRDAKPV